VLTAAAELRISGLCGHATARFTRKIKRSDFWDRAGIDTPPGPFDDSKFRLD
jgi:hypothetical protein